MQITSGVRCASFNARSLTKNLSNGVDFLSFETILRIAAQGNIESFIFPLFQDYAYVDCRFASYVGLNLSLFYVFPLHREKLNLN